MINVLYNSFNCNEQYHNPCNPSCNMNCTPICNHDCNVSCTPNISCTPNCNVDCTPNVSCTPNHGVGCMPNVSCTPNYGVGCMPNVSCTPNYGVGCMPNVSCTPNHGVGCMPNVSCTPNYGVDCMPNVSYTPNCSVDCPSHHNPSCPHPCNSYFNNCCPSNMHCNSCHSNISIEQTILNICETENSYFLTKANVIGCGLGTKIVNGCKTGEKCIKIYVTKKLCANEIPPVDLIPLWYKGIRTDVVESGIIKTLSLTSKVRPIPAGYCISPQGSTVMGTCGCLVKDAMNELYILGSAHVFTDYGTLALGTTIVQPAVINGGTSNDGIATLTNAIPRSFSNSTTIPTVHYIDAAIGKVMDPASVSTSILYVGTPTGVSNAQLDECVKKVGATTELTNGHVDSIGTTIMVQCPNGNCVLFKKQVITTIMGTCGDSGAVLLNKCNQAVGLSCAGSSTVTVYNDMANVLSALNVTLVTNG